MAVHKPPATCEPLDITLQTICGFLWKNVPQDAATTCHKALHPSLKDVTGQYFVDFNKSNCSAYGRDPELAHKLWTFSQELIDNFLWKNVPQDAATTCYTALHPSLKDVTGQYFVDSNKSSCSAYGRDPELAHKLWTFSQELIDKRVLKFFSSFLWKNVPQDAATTCHTALHPSLKDVTGQYFVDSNKSSCSAYGRDPELAHKLWTFSQELIDKRVLKFFSSFLWKNVPQDAATTCYMALHPSLKDVTGQYFVDSNKSSCSAYGRDPELAHKLWTFSQELIESVLRPKGVLKFFSSFLWKNVPQDAATTCYTALHPSLKDVTRQYFVDSNKSSCSAYGRDPELAHKLRTFSQELIDKRVLKFFSSFLWKNVPQDAATTCYTALHPSLKDVTGQYFVDSNKSSCSAYGRDPELAHKLWTFSQELIDKRVLKFFSSFLWKNVPQDAATTCYTALRPSLKDVTGQYFVDFNKSNCSAYGRDPELAHKLWTFSQELIDKHSLS
ncbi:hypothetical protein SELMODRAFT_431511 [Selaginella moellendorffii]|uniref:Uncharacterized protein n=1 Tax=Selaginella moellendorffii TaxID=88036 RepID=D8TCW7_SELML|nr:hypothetical protein SELMODRAFT_431511 [Selaginella moellendorffii]